MPRIARIKNSDSVFHIMCRSISEVSLYRDRADKIKYLTLLKEYQTVFSYKIYAYCLMNSHNHILIDANGADISKVFHGINLKYARYYNKKYKRHGHLFQDRFKSKIVDESSYLIQLSGYIHANPLSMKKYKKSVEKYEFSSLGAYLGINDDKFNLIDKNFIMSQFSQDEASAKSRYLAFIKRCTDNNISCDIEFKFEGTKYVSGRKVITRSFTVENIISFLEKKYSISSSILKLKNNRKATENRAIFILLMRNLCDYKYNKICEIIGNITQSRVSSLCSLGADLVMKKGKYNSLIKDFLNESLA
ncbi:MAG: transposase IS200-family protein [Clostridiaceae bacterium]|nr:transposase IS200-family protein [Clostridiaceae bacterium]